MNLEDYRVVFSAVGLIGVLLLASPALSLVLRLPSGEKFSQLWVLGPGHMATDYPFNVTEGENYLVYVGVGNHLGSSAYYALYVKFRNETEPLPNSTAETPSVLAPLYTYLMFVQDNGSSEVPLTFSFSNESFSDNESTVGNLAMNGVSFAVDKTVSWDAENSGYYYQLFLELWLYDAKAELMQYNNRFVSIWLNMTVPV